MSDQPRTNVRWTSLSDGTAAMTLTINYSEILAHGLVAEHERMIRGLVEVRDAVADMHKAIVPPRLMPDADGAMCARAGVPVTFKVVAK